MPCLLTEQGISLGLLSSKAPLKSRPPQHRAYLWQPVTKHYSIYPAKILAPKHHYSVSHRNSPDLFLQHERTLHFPSPPHRAARVPPASSWDNSAALFILPHCLCSGCYLGQKDFPDTQYSKKKVAKLLQNTTGPTLKAERTSSHQFARWFWTEQLTDSQCCREN